MATLGHGPSKSTCDKCYHVTVEPNDDDPSQLVTISVFGRHAYQGFLLQVKNEKNETVGEFAGYNEKIYAPVACDDEAGEEDYGVLGHVDASLKSWPTRVGWTIPSTDTFLSLRVQGMVVLDLENYHLLPETTFKIKRRPALSSSFLTASSPTIPAPTSMTTQPVTSVIPSNYDEDSNQLFVHVLGVIMGIYFVMAMVQYQLQRRRRAHKSRTEQNALTKDW
ncbi:hypothetical protein DFQ28_007248 [Apophysomyces sp. BC1034]|nr:hypothetical protein DFQ30_006344 [Apophysomyces sp. BC1015]KAG0182286.1 hypothetical protein DFQ29_005017 [Apophysomyces sp. BC1021]KAG0192905.1 hypothetical protein DFQ28_007248 [Apophysomyces sp. BC1034]